MILAVLTLLFKPDKDNLTSVAGKIEDKLNQAESAFEKTVKNKELLQALAAHDESNTVLDGLKQKGLFIYYYQHDSLLHWTDQSVAPLQEVSSIAIGSSFLHLKNGWYAAFKWSDTSTTQTVLALRPVKYDYLFENKFLKNEFALGLNVPHNIELSDQKIAGSIPVKTIEGETLFSLYVSGKQRGEDVNYILLFAQLALLFILFYYLHRFAVQLVRQKNFLSGFSVLLLSVTAIRLSMLLFNFPGEFNQLALFDPSFYASSIITKSLGDLIINSVLITWVTFFFTHYYKPQQKEKTNRAFLFSGIAFIFMYSGFIGWIYKTLVMDSIISFEVYNILSLNAYSFLGIACLSLLFITHFAITRAVLMAFKPKMVSQKQLLVFCLLGGAALSVFAIHSPVYESVLFTALWTVAFVVFCSFMMNKNGQLSVQHLILYIAFYSLLSAFLTENLYERKERNQRLFFSGKLVTERDFVAEYLFEDVAQRMQKDLFIHNFLNNPLISKKELYDRIGSLYLGGYFNKYEVKIYDFDASGNSLRNEDTMNLSFYRTAIKTSLPGKETIHFLSDTSRNYSYLSILDIKNDSALIGSLAIRLLPKIYYGQNVYPELLLGDNVTVSNNVNNYVYAIYQNDKLIAQYGDYPFTYYWKKSYSFSNGETEFIEEPNWELNIQKFQNGKKVIVAIPREPIFEPIATFSYLFTFYFLALVLFLLAMRLVNDKQTSTQLLSGFTLSFRTRINYSMLLMIILSFIIIGLITISFFSKQYANFYTDRLFRKEKVVHATLEYFVQQNMKESDFTNSHSNNLLESELARIADINAVDINLFYRTGDLALSSQPFIYDKGLVSRQMNPVAYFDLESNKSAQVTMQENIGKLRYIARYAPIRNSKGEAMAYIGIPYFERSKNIDDEVSSFLIALMNVYVFLLICAAILAYFVSNSITRPLTIISEKLRILNLNKKNEPIEWNSKDEIGVLVSEYNKMINELEQSAQKLAKGERESAWREMAKQIAHEIKNPLTPMKLSVQYLQRAIAEGQPNIEELAKKMSRTLEEQIENLSSIATAFSTFAKMPKPENEIINLNELLKSIVELFNREETANISFSTQTENPLVFCDKNQLVSVFNNLVKNAIQSIPEDRKGLIELAIVDEAGWLSISVKDNGNGIPHNLYNKVFVPNFTTKSSGTGLGLAITKQIIDGAGGKIWFESEDGMGTTFYIKLRLIG